MYHLWCKQWNFQLKLIAASDVHVFKNIYAFSASSTLYLVCNTFTLEMWDKNIPREWEYSAAADILKMMQIILFLINKQKKGINTVAAYKSLLLGCFTENALEWTGRQKLPVL